MPTVGERIAGVVTHVEFDRNSCSGFGQLCEGSEVDHVAQEIENYINSGSIQIPIQNVREGDVVLALFDADGVWYRGRILTKNPEVLTVFFIDYGNTELVAPENVRQVPHSLVDRPSLAKFCHFVEINASGSEWRQDEKDKIEEMLVNEEFDFEIVSPGSSGSLNVRLLNDRGNVMYGGSLHAEQDDISLRTSSLQPGSSLNAFLSYVDSANKFWIQNRKQEANLTNLMSDIANHVTKGADSLTNPSLGTFCLATYSEDGEPYRSQILTSNSGRCLVQFVDYGNSESKNVNELMSLPDRFRLLPIQGLKCCYKRTKINPNVLEDKLQSLTESEDGVQVHVISKSGDEYTVEIEQIEKESSDAGVNGVSTGEFKHNFTKTILTINSVNDIGVSYVCHPGKFYIQLHKHMRPIEELTDKVAEEYITSRVLTDTTPGTSCLAKMSDGDIYRSAIKRSSGQGVTVFAVDYGFEEEVDRSCVKVLPPDLMSQPAYCVECTVDVTKLDEGNWSQQEIDLLKEFESSIPVVAKISSQRGNIYQLDLYDTRDDVDRYINAELLGTGKSKQNRPTNAAPAPREPRRVDVPPPKIAVGSKELVCVTAVKSSSLFYAQLTKIPVEDFAELQQKLSTMYEKPQDSISTDNVGTFCAAKYVDGAWYRAIITSTTGGTAEVAFIDFGDSCSQSISALKLLKPDIASTPQLCIKCQLSQVPRNLQKEDVERLILNKALEVKLSSKTGKCTKYENY